jgi:hypothetical protein
MPIIDKIFISAGVILPQILDDIIDYFKIEK